MVNLGQHLTSGRLKDSGKIATQLLSSGSHRFITKVPNQYLSRTIIWILPSLVTSCIYHKHFTHTNHISKERDSNSVHGSLPEIGAGAEWSTALAPFVFVFVVAFVFVFVFVFTIVFAFWLVRSYLLSTLAAGRDWSRSRMDPSPPLQRLSLQKKTSQKMSLQKIPLPLLAKTSPQAKRHKLSLLFTSLTIFTS